MRNWDVESAMVERGMTMSFRQDFAQKIERGNSAIDLVTLTHAFIDDSAPSDYG